MANIGVIGSKGAMGEALRRVIEASGHDYAGGADKGDDVSKLADVSDILVDFSAPGALQSNLHAAVGAGIPIVIGTTCLEDKPHPPTHPLGPPAGFVHGCASKARARSERSMPALPSLTRRRSAGAASSTLETINPLSSILPSVTYTVPRFNAPSDAVTSSRPYRSVPRNKSRIRASFWESRGIAGSRRATPIMLTFCKTDVKMALFGGLTLSLFGGLTPT